MEKMIDYLITLAEREVLGQAYIFFGPAPFEKMNTAKSLAAYIESGNVLQVHPKNEPPRNLTDAQVFSPDDKGTIGIDTARSVSAFLRQKPFVGSRRTAIIDRAELLTPEAQNALLKVAEEPPASALIILILPDPELLRSTLQSRFQKIYFPSPADRDVKPWFEARYGENAKDAAALAARFFKTPPAGRKDFVKELTEPEDFNFTAFLDSLIAHLAGPGAADVKSPAWNSRLWHAVLELRRMQDATNLSPRIQLMNLWTLI